MSSPFIDRTPDVYALDGLTVQSSIRLPAPRIPDPAAHPDVMIDVAYAPEFALNDDPVIEIGGDTLTFNWVPMGYCTVSGGARIDILTTPEIDLSVWMDATLNDAMGVLLSQRGALVLHASAVAVDGQAVIFAAESGFGKSTTAAALSARGHQVLSDDKAALHFDPHTQRLIMYPTVSRLKLLPESYRAVAGDETGAEPVHAGSRKLAYTEASAAGAFDALPVAAIYLLRYGDSNTVEMLSPGETIVQISAHAYMTHVCESYGTPLGVVQSYLRRDIEFIARALPYLNVRRLKRRQGLDQLADLAEFIEHDVRAGIATPPTP